MRLRRVTDDNHAFSLGDLDALGRTAEAGSTKGRLRILPDLVW